MTELLIFIHHPEQAREAVDHIASAICPNLRTLGERASISATEHARKLCGGNDSSSATVLRLSLVGSSQFDFAYTVAKLEKSLKSNAKDAKLELTFDVWRVEPAAPAMEP